MENASNALIIAGEILIAVLVISLFAYIVVQFGNFSTQMHEEMAESQVVTFNSNFTKYSYRANITAQEIATAINFAKQANDNKDLDWNDTSEYYTTVYIDGKNVFNSSSYIKNRDEYNNNDKINEVILKFIKDNNTKYFSCNASLEKRGSKINKKTYDSDIHYNEKTALINRIDFHSISTGIINVPNSF